ncbi:MAG: hypothetical protein HRF42_05535 [Candidatus Brocadia sp.]|jgi:hypothetical protein
MIPDAYVSHQSFRRSRIKVPSKRGDERYFTHINNRFKGFKGVETIDVNPVTGSILFIHTVDFKSIKEYAEENNLFTMKNNSSVPLFNRSIKTRFNNFDNRIKTLSGKEIDIPGIAFLTLLGLGISDIGRGNARAMPWHAAFWYALNVFLMKKPVG